MEKKNAETAAPPVNDGGAPPTMAHQMEMLAEEHRMTWGGGSAPSLPSVDDDQHEDEDVMSISSGSVRSSTMSIDSTLYHFVEENGRTYHKYKQGRYLFPNDSQEQERLDLQHQLFCLTIGGKLNLAPLPERPMRVLDIATGTGIWAIEFATQYPEAEVIGTDLSPIQPHYLPENCKFEIDDCEDDWAFTEPFTYIHGRALLSCFQDPERVIRQAYENLEPGGLIEFQDAFFPLMWVGEPAPDSPLLRWNNLLLEGLRNLGRNWSNVVNYPQYFRNAGFENVVERRFYWPTGPWAKGRYFKTIAMYYQEDLLAGVEGIGMKVLVAAGLSVDEILELSAAVKKDIQSPNCHAYATVCYTYGQKPLAK